MATPSSKMADYSGRGVGVRHSAGEGASASRSADQLMERADRRKNQNSTCRLYSDVKQKKTLRREHHSALD